MKTLKTLQLIDYQLDSQNCIKFGVVNPIFKVENILKGSLGLIPSPSLSVKIKLWAGKFAAGVKAKRCWALSTNKKFVDITQQCFASLPQISFPANNLNFH